MSKPGHRGNGVVTEPNTPPVTHAIWADNVWLVSAAGADDRFAKGFRGDPPEVAGEVIGWLAAEPDANRFRGKMVHAQALCAKLDLVPGWAPQR